MAYVRSEEWGGGGGGDGRPRDYQAELGRYWPSRNPNRREVLRVSKEWVADAILARCPRLNMSEVISISVELGGEIFRLFDQLKDERDGHRLFCHHLAFEIDDRCGPERS